MQDGDAFQILTTRRITRCHPHPWKYRTNHEVWGRKSPNRVHRPGPKPR